MMGAADDQNMVSFVINTCISLVFSVVGKFQVIWTLNLAHYFLLLLHEETLYNTMHTVWISWNLCVHSMPESRKVGNFGLRYHHRYMQQRLLSCFCRGGTKA